MLQVSRDNNLKIPKNVEDLNEVINSNLDKAYIKEAIATANDEKICKSSLMEQASNDKELELSNKIPQNSNDLIVITMAKKLCAYVITITQKSPKKYRGVFVNRMQNLCLDTIELLLKANFTKMDNDIKKEERADFQKEAIIKLKMLGYISMLAQSSQCILMRQYKLISLQIGEIINLIAAWKKSDDSRWKKK